MRRSRVRNRPGVCRSSIAASGCLTLLRPAMTRSTVPRSGRQRKRLRRFRNRSDDLGSGHGVAKYSTFRRGVLVRAAREGIKRLEVVPYATGRTRRSRHRRVLARQPYERRRYEPSACQGSRRASHEPESPMTLCPVALAIGCKKCPIVRVCLVKGLIGDYKPKKAARGAPRHD